MRSRLLLALCLSALAGCSGAASTNEAASAIGDKADSPWCHLNFDSVEGANIRVDYQLLGRHTGNQYVYTAVPTWLNVSSARFDGGEHVHVWIGDSAYLSKEGYASAKQYDELRPYPDTQLDLGRSEDPHRATGQIPGGVTVSEYSDGDDEAWYHAHEVAVVIDGEWQTDPISGSHNFLAPTLYGCSN
jgi:hypothetical protein